MGYVLCLQLETWWLGANGQRHSGKDFLELLHNIGSPSEPQGVSREDVFGCASCWCSLAVDAWQ